MQSHFRGVSSEAEFADVLFVGIGGSSAFMYLLAMFYELLFIIEHFKTGTA